MVVRTKKTLLCTLAILFALLFASSFWALLGQNASETTAQAAGSRTSGFTLLSDGESDPQVYGDFSEAWNAALQHSTSKITMYDDAEVSETLYVQSDKNITLDLNGHKLALAETGRGSVLYINANGVFTLEDDTNNVSYHTGSHTVKIPGTERTVTVEGGVISGGKGTTMGSISCGGGVCVNGAFTMNSGTIVGNAAQRGGGVWVYDGKTFAMNGGAIRDNSAENGGGVYNERGVFTLTDGTIRDNSAELGGGVRNESGTFTMSGGTIRDNTAEIGGGVDSRGMSTGVFTMSGGMVCGNNATGTEDNTYGGGGVFAYCKNFTLRGNAKIYGNTAEKNGGGVLLRSGAFAMEGGTVGGTEDADKNTALTGGGIYVYGGTLDVSGSAVVSANSAENGGGIYVDETLIMRGGAVSGNEATTYGGGVYVDKNGTFTMENGTIGGNVATTATGACGGGVFVKGGTNAEVFSGGKFIMEGGTIGGDVAPNVSNYGGGVRIDENATFTMNGGSISYNTANFDGGGLCVCNAKEITLGGGDISCNHALAGGGIYFEGGTATYELTGTTVEHNAVMLAPSGVTYGNSGNGGGVYIDGSSVSMQGNATTYTSIRFNSASNSGGGVYMKNGVTKDSTLTVSGGTISENTASNSGGGVCNASGTLTVSGGTISGNTAEYGGGVDTDGTFTVSGGTISDNTALTFGGGVYVDDTLTTVREAAEIRGNTAHYGGGVYVSSTGAFAMEGGTVAGNEAVGNHGYGGGVYVYGTFTMTGGTIGGTADTDKNTATEHGGGVYVNGTYSVSGVGIVVWGNSVVGGANETVNNVYLPSYKKIAVAGALYDAEHRSRIGVSLASKHPGVLTDGYGTYNNSYDSTPIFPDERNRLLLFTNPNEGTVELEFAICKAIVTADGYGEQMRSGLIDAWDFVSSIQSRQASITLLADAEANMDLFVGVGRKITLDLNGYELKFTEKGHGIQVEGQFVLQDTYDGTDRTHAVPDLTTDDPDDTVEIVGGVLTGVKSEEGCIYVKSTGECIMESGTIAGNTTKLHYTSDGGSESADYIGGNGGGVCIEGGTFTMKGGAITGNVAVEGSLMHDKGNGGGVYVGNNGTFVMEGGTISGNAAKDGGGVYIDGGTFTVKDGTVSENVATGGEYSDGNGGGVAVHGGTLTMQGGTISGNVVKGTMDNACGGGVHIALHGTFILESGTVSGNTAHYGGGVYVDTYGTFTMTGGTIGGTADADKNTATEHGGGVCVDTDGTFVMEGGTVSGNTAAHGGGVSIQDGTFAMEGGTISGNTAAHGGGVSMFGYGGDFRVSGAVTVTGNKKSASIDADVSNVYLESGRTVTVCGALKDGSKNAQIGITLANGYTGAFTENYGVYNKNGEAVALPVAYFLSDSNGFPCVGLSEGDVVLLAAHEYDTEFTVDTAATCTQDGSKSKHCKHCGGKTEVTAIAATGHDYAADFTVDTQATCTQDGSKSRHCTHCDDRTDITAIAATGHAFGEWTLVKQPTADEFGEEQRVCAHDGSHVETRPIDKLVPSPATDTSPGGKHSSDTAWTVLVVLASVVVAGEIGFIVYRIVRKKKSTEV